VVEEQRTVDAPLTRKQVTIERRPVERRPRAVAGAVRPG
jgi:stress response protein YsnF